MNKDFTWAPGVVSDRKDGTMVHLDGLNFSRAWCLYGLAKQYPEFDYLIKKNYLLQVINQGNASGIGNPHGQF